MQRETLFLKLMVILLGVPVLAICIFAMPEITHDLAVEFIGIKYLQWPMLLGVYVMAFTFFVALYQTFRLLHYIDKNKAFSNLSVKALKNIKTCAIIISLLYVLAMPLFYVVAEEEDAPGVILIGMCFILAS